MKFQSIQFFIINANEKSDDFLRKKKKKNKNKEISRLM